MFDAFAHDPTEFVQSWEPKVGDRVRVRLNGECQRELLPDAQGRTYGGLDHGHFDEENGMTGVVQAWGHQLANCMLFYSAEGHSYRVAFDTDMYAAGQVWRWSEYAANELEPLD